MRYWILPTILEFSGLGLGAFLVISSLRFESNKELMFSVMGLGLGLIALMSIEAQIFRTAHFTRILKKHGLWQDDIVKKKDLPKDK